VAAAYGSGAVTLYKASDGSVVRHLLGHDVSADALVFTPDGSMLVTGGGDGMVKVWRVSDGSLVWMGVGDHLDSVTSVAVSADGSMVASTGIEGVMTVWRADGGQVWSQKLQDSQFNVFFTPDSANVISHDNQPLVQYHRVSDGQVVKEVVLTDAVRLGAISTDGSLLLGIHDSPLPQSGTVAAYRVSDGSAAWQIQSPHTETLSGLAMSADGSTVATTSRDGTVKLWRASDGAALRTIAVSGPGASVALLADGSSVAAGTFAGDLAIYRAADGAPLASVAAPPGHAGTVFQVSFSPDGNLLASVALSNGNEDHSAKIWRVSDGSLLRTIPDAGAQTTQALAFSPDSGFVAVALPPDDRVHLLRTSDGTEMGTVGNTASGWGAFGVAVSPDGTTVAAGCRCAGPAFRPVRLFKLDGSEDLGVGDFGQMAMGFAFSPDGASIAVAQGTPGSATTLKLWRLVDRSEVWHADIPPAAGAPAFSLTFSRDGKQLAAAPLFDSNLTVYQVSDGTPLHTGFLEAGGTENTLGALSFSSDGGLLGVAVPDGLAVFRTRDWTRVGTLGKPTSFVGAAFAPNAPRAAAAGQNGVVYQWCDVAF
jgi:WD40 repeat protein